MIYIKIRVSDFREGGSTNGSFGYIPQKSKSRGV
jgi:hypothetical protein